MQWCTFPDSETPPDQAVLDVAKRRPGLVGIGSVHFLRLAIALLGHDFDRVVHLFRVLIVAGGLEAAI